MWRPIRVNTSFVRKGFFVIGLFLFSGLALIACAHPLTLGGQISTKYHRLLSDHTHEKKLYGLEKVEYQTAVTYKSLKLRQAYVEEYAKRYYLSENEKQKLLESELKEAEKYEVFLVSHFATDKDAANVTKLRNVWRITLLTPLGSQEPIDPDSVIQLSSKDSKIRYFYPHVSAWSKIFLVKFKKQNMSPELELKMVGVVSDLSFKWTQAP